MNKQKIITLLLIPVCLLVIATGGYLIVDYFQGRQRDLQRQQLIKKVQEGLENYYKANHYYPGTPYYDENKFIVYADWHYLITFEDLINYYDFSKFKDPCEPQKPVNILGLVKCPGQEVKYQYFGIGCTLDKIGCQGYKLVINLEKGGTKEFISQTIIKEINNEKR